MLARIILLICFILTIIEAVGGCCSHLNALFLVLIFIIIVITLDFLDICLFFFNSFIIPKVFMSFMSLCLAYTAHLQSVVGA